jgi:hypothetical protein
VLEITAGDPAAAPKIGMETDRAAITALNSGYRSTKGVGLCTGSGGGGVRLTDLSGNFANSQLKKISLVYQRYYYSP